MKSLTVLSLLLIALVAHGQESTNPFIKHLKNNFPVSENFLLNESPSEDVFKKNLLPKEALMASVTTKERMYIPNQVNSATINMANDFAPYLGSSSIKDFEFGNTKARSTYIFDAAGNLRSSQFSFSFGKKK